MFMSVHTRVHGDCVGVHARVGDCVGMKAHRWGMCTRGCVHVYVWLCVCMHECGCMCMHECGWTCIGMCVQEGAHMWGMGNVCM